MAPYLLMIILALAAGCGEDDPIVAPSVPPTIESVTANPAIVPAGTATTLSVTATDPDSESLRYSWSALDGGTITSPNQRTAEWIAPGSPANYRILIVVSDGFGSDSRTISITVVRGA
ncbi:MAG: hypothetical protein GF346_00185 [Candidatus Eisenbacteria bacterium]|nr:hypothetical protein [Candidatus Latescibacterota bacterium]MBD3300850.1 hypothetical protein [Candidatus Eisenbacteria bacterium]